MQSKKEESYLNILKALDEIPFNVGKNLLIDFLQGNGSNDSIRRNRLSRMISFGSLEAYEKDEIEEIINNLIFNGLIIQKAMDGSLYKKILALAEKGREELIEPRLHQKRLANYSNKIELRITDEDLMMFKNFDFFLRDYNDEQKKAIICNAEKILCIAGAGSGKTTVLTKKIEFLTQFKSVNSEKILAITFTRKARAEMISRLSNKPLCSLVAIETFNSFSEKMLGKYNDLLYSKKIRVINFGDKVNLINLALNSLNINFQVAIENYFSVGEKKGKTNEELAKIFTNDCFFVLDYCKNYNKKLEELFSLKELAGENKYLAEMIYKICANVQKSMETYGLRDYADQLVECIRLFKTHKETIPQYEHVLIDEYQDINQVQAELIDILNPMNIFCVGDPRQAIFGWRGAKISYILKFQEKYPSCAVIPLSINYRSPKTIVQIMNLLLSAMNLPELESSINDKGDIRLIEFESESAEMEFVIQSILHKKEELGKVFVLGRTNKLILELSDRMKLSGIKHIVRAEEITRYIESADANITLATVHSIKGMEADTVFVIGCTQNNFPCRGSEHPVIEMIKIDDYDKEEEERRLFYVAISRAQKRLFITYAKNLTRFVSEKMKSFALVSKSNKEVPLFNTQKSEDAMKRLKEWRGMLAQELGIPAYIIMHDKTLIEIATMKPSCIEDLENIYGLGPAKIKKYGEEILRVVYGG